MKWHIPTVLTTTEILDKAFRSGSKIKPANQADRKNPKKIYLSKIGAVSGTIQSKLISYIRRFPSVNQFEVSQGRNTDVGIASFYYDLFEFTFGVDRMKKALGNLDWAVNKTREMESIHVKQLKKTNSRDEMEKIRSAFYGRISSIIGRLEKDLKFLAKAREEIKRMPDIPQEAVVVVVAGAPNVGKSSLINMISSGNSQIAPYPFTTKGIFLGHLVIERTKVVLVDTPGLLDRMEQDRNDIELKAASAVQNLSSAVIFMLDPSETSGMPLASQESLVSNLRKELYEVPNIVVENKCDVLSRETENVLISCETGQGKEVVMEWLESLVAE